MPTFMVYTKWNGTSRYEIEAESEEHAEDIFWDDYSGNDSFESMEETSKYDDEHVSHIEELREFDDAKD